MNLSVFLVPVLVALSAAGVGAQSKTTVRPKPESVQSQTPTQTPVKSNERDETSERSEDGIESKRVEATGDATQYVYEFNQPRFTVSRFVVKHDAQGRGSIVFERQNDAEPYTEPFALSPVALERINTLLAKLDFLNSTQDYQFEKDFSHLGNNTFGLKAKGRARTAKFNYTKNPDAAALVAEYRRVMDQALFIFDINLARTNQPLEAPGVMKRLETLVSRNGISDLAQLAPLLRDLTTDERIPLIARNKAGKLLKKIEK